jgi:hypothetical protein
MIIKEFNSNNYIFIDKNKYVNVKHYYEELIKIKFNKKQHSHNIISELKTKINIR